LSDTTETSPAPAASEVASLDHEPFRDPSLLLRWVTALLALCSLAALVALVLRVFEYALLEQIANRAFSSQEELVAAANASDARVQFASGARAVLYIATTIPFGMWIYRAAKNTRALGATGLNASPGWAVGSYFVPIVNLFAPFIAMKEIWRASLDPGNWQAARSTPLLGWWWFLWIVNGLAGWAGQTMLSHPQSVAEAEHGSLVASAQNVAQIALNIVALLLVKRITANQLWQSKIANVF